MGVSVGAGRECDTPGMRQQLSAIWHGTPYAGPPTGVPRPGAMDRLNSTTMAGLSILCVVLAALSVRPVGVSGRGLLGLFLLLGCAIAVLSRFVPDRVLTERRRAVVVVVGGVFAAAMFGYAPATWGVSFAFMLCGHVGYRWRPQRSIPYAGCVAVAAALAVLVGGHDGMPALLALSTALTVFAGLARRERTLTLQAANEAVLQARRASESEARAGALAERARIARDIHDVLAHSLSGVNMQLSLAETLLEAGRPQDGLTAVRRARAVTVEGIGEVRKAVQTLREHTIDLPAALAAMVGEEGVCRVDATVAEMPTVPPEVAQSVLRIAQESVTNARRHAPGAPLRLDLNVVDEALHLRIVNQHPSGPVAPSPGSGLGLVGMRERAAAVSGRVDTGPTSEGGWQVLLTVPVPRPETTETTDEVQW